MADLETRKKQYIDHWSSKPTSPASIGWVESLFNKVRKGIWRPIEDSDTCVDHRLISHDRATYEELIPDYSFESTGDGIEHEKIKNAQTIEIKHRIFKAIYWGNLFDDILPIETRYYTASTDRFIKLAFISICFCLFVLAITLSPSLFNNTFYEKSALQATSKSSLRFYINEEEIGERFLQKIGLELDPGYKSKEDISAFERIIEIRKASKDLVFSANEKSLDVVESIAWKNSENIEKRKVISDAVFFYWISLDPDKFQEFNRSARFLVTPENNSEEILSQLAVVVFIVVMISWFVARKKSFFSVVGAIPFSKRIPSVQALEETLMSFFILRKKYHYIVAFSVASFVVLCHYFTMSKMHVVASYDASIALDLKPFDYRLNSSTQPLLSTYWFAQFFIVYLFTLVAWELGALSHCFKQWQGKLIKLKIIEKNEFKKYFDVLLQGQKGVLAGAFLLIFVSLGALSYMKFLDIQPEYIWLSTYDLSGAMSMLAWGNWLIFYIFSPPILSFMLIVYSLSPCHANYDSALKYSDKKLPDLDQALLQITASWKKIKVAEKWIDGVLTEHKDEDEKNNKENVKND